LNSQHGATFPQVVFKHSLEYIFTLNRRVFVFTRSIPLTSFNLPFKFISIFKAHHSLLCVHLIIQKAAEVLRPIFKNHLSETLKNVFTYLAYIQDCKRVLTIKPVLSPAFHLVSLKTTRKLIASLIDGAAPTMSTI
jgi:hypothetical protein